MQRVTRLFITILFPLAALAVIFALPGLVWAATDPIYYEEIEAYDSGEDPIDWTDTAAFSAAGGPQFDIWYGSNQSFGQLGNPQYWVNILGNVSDPDGIASLSYRLNGGPTINLNIGPDNRRLADPGDFNIDIDRIDLVDGPNQVIITARDNLDNESIEIVTLDYSSNSTWPLPYAVDWSTVTNFQDAAQVVDGLWSLEPDGVRTIQIDYDRVLAIGDLNWTDYEATVPITVHGWDPAGPTSGSPGFGITLRWRGHSDNPVNCGQPHCGWLPSGAGSWYWMADGGPLGLDGLTDSSVSIGVGETWYWKMRVETIDGVGPKYSLKVWQSGQAEPVDWMLTQQRDLNDLSNGSAIVIAHHVDITVGDVTVVPLVPVGPLVSDDFNSCTLNSGLWTFVNPLADGTMALTGEAVVLSLPEGTTHDTWGTNAGDFVSTVPRIRQRIADGDFEMVVKLDGALSANTQMEGILVEQDANDMLRLEFLHNGAALSAFAASFTEGANSVKYNEVIANSTPLYMKVARVGDVWTQSYSSDGAAWTDMSSFTHAMTVNAVSVYAGNSTVANEVIIDYVFNSASPIVPEDAIVHTVAVTKVGAGMVNKSPDQAGYACGDEVTLMAVGDGGWEFSNWSGALSSSTNPEIFTIVDGTQDVTATFVEIATPTYTLSTNVVGNGSVMKVPDKTAYDAGELVTLTPVADGGWVFSSWSGNVSGSNNPLTVVMAGNKSITATFTEIPPTSYTIYLSVIGP